MALAAEAVHYGAPDRLELHSGSPPPGVSLGLGRAVQGGVWVDARGWVAATNRVLPVSGALPAPGFAAPAAVFAACCGLAKLFSLIVLGRDVALGEAWSLPLLGLGRESSGGLGSKPSAGPRLTTPSGSGLDVGDLVLAGAGAVGAGFVATLRLSDWSARLWIIDPDRYEEPNLETTILIGKQDVLSRRPKAEAMAGYLAGRMGIRATASLARVEDILSSPTDEARLLISAVDSRSTRRALDATPVRTILNAAVGGSLSDAGHVLWSRHGPEDPPLTALYPEAVEAPRLRATAPPVEVGDPCCRLVYEGVTMAVPFVGVAAGALLAAACGSAPPAAPLHCQNPRPAIRLDLTRLPAKS